MTSAVAREVVSVVGLGKLGAPIAAAFASRGHRVIGVDSDPATVAAVNSGVPPATAEPHLAELFAAHRDRLSATADFGTAVRESTLTFVIVPTPSTESGDFSLRFVLDAIESAGRALRGKDGYHLLVVTSTITPGSMETSICPALERASGRKVGDSLGLCYNPQFIALGTVVRDLLNPDFVLIGESDPDAGLALAAFLGKVCENRPAVARMSFVNAELTKLAVNTYVTTKISYANMLAEVCERLAGADVDVVTRALGFDSRIGGKYLRGALGYGGPCFPRDNAAFSALARRIGAPALLAEATDRTNRHQASRLAELVLGHLPSGGIVAILGLAYKPGTDVIEASPGITLARELAERAAIVRVYDPAGLEKAREELGERVDYATGVADCTRSADVVIVCTPWDEFKTLSADQIGQGPTRPTVIDPWRLFAPERFIARCHYVTLGAGSAS